MNNIEELSFIATGLAIMALFSWIAGDRSFRGRELLIRSGPAWVALRWFGLGLWIATLIASGHADYWLELAGLAGASFLLFGTARRAKMPRPKLEIYNQTGEQAVAPNRPLAPSLKSTSTVRGSED